MNKHNILMAAMAGVIVAIVAAVVSSIVGLAIGEKNIVVEALSTAAGCFTIFFAAFLVIPLWDTSERKHRDANPSH